MPTFAKTHEECRTLVCIICMKKGDQELSKTYKVKNNFNFKRVPLATCVSCRSNLSKLCDGKTKVVSQLYNFETIAIKVLTRFSTVCKCLI